MSLQNFIKNTRPIGQNLLGKMNVKIKKSSKYLSIAKIIDKDSPSDFVKWDQIKQELLRGVFEKNSGCLVTASTYAFEDNDIPYSESVLKVDSTLGKTYILFNKHWTLAELEKIATSSQFELAELWMRPDLDRTANDSDHFWNFVNKLNSPGFNFDMLVGDIQTIGCLNDGNWILWTNPTPEKVDMVLEDMKKLCLKLKVGMEDISCTF